MILPGSSIVQMAWVVNDLEVAARKYSATLGYGPFMFNRHIRLSDPRHRGVSMQTDFSLAIAQAGDVQVELVQQHDDTPSVYRDIYAKGCEGFHHVAVIVPDVGKEVARYQALGFTVASTGRFGDVEFAYVDTVPVTGHMVEILPDQDGIRRLFGAVRRAAENWDGVDPIREMS